MANGVSDLCDFLKDAKLPEFSAKPFYEKHTDSLIFYVRNRPSYSVRLNSLLTVFLDNEDDTLVGTEVKGVTRLLQLWKSFGVAVVDHKIKLGILLAFALSEPAENPALEKTYFPALQKLGEIEVDKRDLDPTLAC